MKTVIQGRGEGPVGRGSKSARKMGRSTVRQVQVGFHMIWKSTIRKPLAWPVKSRS